MKRVRESLPITDPNLKQALMEYGHAINGLKSLFKEDADGNEYLDKIRNANGDTYVTVEKTADEDIIHFYTAGSERLTLDGNTLYFRDPNGSISNKVIDFRNGYEIYSDDTGAGSDNTRLWFDAPDGGEMVLGPRAGADYLGNMRLRTDNLHVESASGGQNVFTVIGDSIGIGTSAPDRKIHLKAAVPYMVFEDTDSGKQWAIGVSNTEFRFYEDLTTLQFRFAGGTGYANTSWTTFSPIMPKGVKGYGWLEVAKEDAYKPHKPDTLKLEDMTEEDIRKYSKDATKIAMANTRLLDYMVKVQKENTKKINQLAEQLNDLQEQINDIRQSATKKSIN